MSATHSIKIITEDGEAVYFDCRSDEDLITAAVRQYIYLMSSCRAGGCATCKAYCAEGEYHLTGCSVQALPPDEEEEGRVLLCRCYPESDLELEVPYTYSRISFEPDDQTFSAEVISLKHISSNAVRLHLRQTGSNGERQIRFGAGQFMELQVPGTELTRAYSPANISNDDGDLEFLIRLLPDGVMSNCLKSGLFTGQSIQVKGPQGVFGIKENGLRPRYFIAGGTGLAPVLSMIRHMQYWGAQQETRLYFGVTYNEELFLLDELFELKSSMKNLTVRICVWKHNEETAAYCERGNVIEVLKADLESKPARPDIYLCGPPGMVDAAHQVCAEFGIPKEQIYLEKFLPSGPCGEACDPTITHEHHQHHR
jgi:methane monooxygenase component C